MRIRFLIIKMNKLHRNLVRAFLLPSCLWSIFCGEGKAFKWVKFDKRSYPELDYRVVLSFLDLTPLPFFYNKPGDFCASRCQPIDDPKTIPTAINAEINERGLTNITYFETYCIVPQECINKAQGMKIGSRSCHVCSLNYYAHLWALDKMVQNGSSLGFYVRMCFFDGNTILRQGNHIGKNKLSRPTYQNFHPDERKGGYSASPKHANVIGFITEDPIEEAWVLCVCECRAMVTHLVLLNPLFPQNTKVSNILQHWNDPITVQVQPQPKSTLLQCLLCRLSHPDWELVDFPPFFINWLQKHPEALQCNKEEVRNLISLLQDADEEVVSMMKVDPNDMFKSVLLSSGKTFSEDFLTFIQQHLDILEKNT